MTQARLLLITLAANGDAAAIDEVATDAGLDALIVDLADEMDAERFDGMG